MRKNSNPDFQLNNKFITIEITKVMLVTKNAKDHSHGMGFIVSVLNLAASRKREKWGRHNIKNSIGKKHFISLIIHVIIDFYDYLKNYIFEINIRNILLYCYLIIKIAPLALK